MKKYRYLFLFVIVGALAVSTWFIAANGRVGKLFAANDPDMPVGGPQIDREEYIRARLEQLDMMQGNDTAQQQSRTSAIRQMERSELALRARLRAADQPEAASWIPLGPAPIPGPNTSGRTSAIAVHPTNPDIAYVGTAQGGLYRTLNGGQTWTPLMDSALTLAIGAVAIAPSDPTTVYVGTGESTQCSSGCFIGVGVYRITNADTNPVLTGPLNRDAANADIFTGRAISEILVHPTDANTIFVSTTSGIAGIGAVTTGLTLPPQGVYRSTNAMGANPTFAKLNMGLAAGDRNVTDLVMEPGVPDHIYAGVIGVNAGDGGVYVTANALSASPTWTQALSTSLTGSGSRVELTATKVGGVLTVWAASGQGNGTVYKSVDPAPFTQSVANGFCSSQCFYDVAIASDPTDANRVYLAGSPTLVFGRSTNGGTSFTSASSGINHPDSHAITIAPSNPAIAYFGEDGGIWRTTNLTTTGTVSWTSLNNSTFSATQFMGLAVHPSDRNYSLGGTQDNGTEFLAPDGRQWINSDGGDGGFAAIDQTSPNTTNVTAYHTYYNQSGTQIGFSRATTTVPPGDPNWGGLLGCGGTPNGINCADATLFYAPMVVGPSAGAGNPNTVYFGTNHVYRSTNQGATMTDVSGTLPVRVGAIAAAPGPNSPLPNDDVRLAGSVSGGAVYLSTTAASTTMTNVSGGQIPSRYIGRVAIDPTNSNVAYVCLNGFGLTNNHVMKTTNLLSGAVTWTPAGSGIPDTPVDSFAIDPTNTQNLFAGTDIGVFRSMDGGATWTPFSNGLPRVAVFGMALTANGRVLRISTHGRGMWDYILSADRAQADFNGDGRSDLAVYRPSNGTWYYSSDLSDPGHNFASAQWGVPTDVIVPGDYDGDGKTDFAVYRPSEGNWYRFGSSSGVMTPVNFGFSTDLPAQGDYDGDGKTDIAVFRPSDGTWYIIKSSTGFTAVQWGTNGDKPVAGDYDGDGKTDLAVFRPSEGNWYRLGSSAGIMPTFNFGLATDKVVPADYDGDGKTDMAVYRDSNGTWYRINSFNGSSFGLQYGASGDIPTPGDYDGDGKADISVFRPTDGNWYRLNSRDGSPVTLNFGVNGDTTIEARYVPVQ